MSVPRAASSTAVACCRVRDLDGPSGLPLRDLTVQGDVPTEPVTGHLTRQRPAEDGDDRCRVARLRSGALRLSQRSTSSAVSSWTFRRPGPGSRAVRQHPAGGDGLRDRPARPNSSQSSMAAATVIRAAAAMSVVEVADQFLELVLGLGLRSSRRRLDDALAVGLRSPPGRSRSTAAVTRRSGRRPRHGYVVSPSA